MIRISYKGRTGNQLFQYAFARLNSFGATEFDLIEGFYELSPVSSGEVYFEKASSYIARREEIRSWFKLEGPPIDGIAIHVRGGDAAEEGFRCPPIKYYDEAMDCMVGKFLPVTVFTDDTLDPIAQEVAALHKATIVSSDPISDFHSLRRYQTIIIGNSTFAWWAAFLSGHNNVIQCEPTLGWRSKLQPESCLVVPEWRQIQYDPAPNH